MKSTLKWLAEITMLTVMVISGVVAIGASTNLGVWVYGFEPYSMNQMDPEWYLNVYSGQTACTLEEPGALTGNVQCSNGAPSGIPTDEGHPLSAPVSILD